MGCGGLTLRSNEMMHECMNVSVSSTWSSMKWMDERGTCYGTVLPLSGEGMLVCVRACVRARVLGWAVLCWAVLCGAVLVRCGAGFIVGV